MEGVIQHTLCKKGDRTECNNYLVIILSTTNTKRINTLLSRLNAQAAELVLK
jgi:hypothetical protein